MSSASAYRLGLLLAGLHFTHHLVSANIVLIHSGTALVVVFPMRTKKVFITSPGHEGSHALCESFQYYLAKVGALFVATRSLFGGDSECARHYALWLPLFRSNAMKFLTLTPTMRTK